MLTYIENLAKEKQAMRAQLSLAWMVCKKPYIVPIPDSRKVELLLENAGAADVELTTEEVTAFDDRLDNMEMSGVLGGSPVK